MRLLSIIQRWSFVSLLESSSFPRGRIQIIENRQDPTAIHAYCMYASEVNSISITYYEFLISTNWIFKAANISFVKYIYFFVQIHRRSVSFDIPRIFVSTPIPPWIDFFLTIWLHTATAAKLVNNGRKRISKIKIQF